MGRFVRLGPATVVRAIAQGHRMVKIPGGYQIYKLGAFTDSGQPWHYPVNCTGPNALDHALKLMATRVHVEKPVVWEATPATPFKGPDSSWNAGTWTPRTGTNGPYKLDPSTGKVVRVG